MSIIKYHSLPKSKTAEPTYGDFLQKLIRWTGKCVKIMHKFADASDVEDCMMIRNNPFGHSGAMSYTFAFAHTFGNLGRCAEIEKILSAPAANWPSIIAQTVLTLFTKTPAGECVNEDSERNIP